MYKIKKIVRLIYHSLPQSCFIPFKYIWRMHKLKMLSIKYVGPHKKIIVFYNFHRLGNVSPTNPFHRLHTISNIQFRFIIKFLKPLGSFISLDQLLDYESLPNLGFCLTFDDVSSSILPLIPFLEENQIPFTICPCTRITNEGMGVRDKVYHIIANKSSSELLDWVRSHCDFPENILDKYIHRQSSVGKKDENEKFNFYRFSKTTEISHKRLEEELVNPLFDALADSVRNSYKAEQPYLNWQQLRELRDNPLVSFSNHGHNHYEISSMTQSELDEDLNLSTKIFESELGFTPQFYTAPFGTPTLKAANKLTEALRARNYRCALWMSLSAGANMLRGNTPNQLLHMFRNHTPECSNRTETLNFLVKSIEKYDHGVPSTFSKKNGDSNIQIIENIEREKVFTFENLVRYGRDYSCSPEFYDYLVESAPIQHDLPKTVATVDVENHIQSLLYMMPAQFRQGLKKIPGSFLSGWRKLPGTHHLAAGLPFKRALKSAPVCGAYLPSPQTEFLYQTNGWHQILSKRFWLQLPLNIPSFSELGADESAIIHSKKCPLGCANLLEAENNKYHFGIERSHSVYSWRLDSYPLADSYYCALYQNNKVKALAAILHTPLTLAITDFVIQDKADFDSLLMRVCNLGLDMKCKWIVFETSIPSVVELMTTKYSISAENIPIYYYLNTKFSDCFYDLEYLKKNWSSMMHHQTMLCGDALIRPGLDSPDSMPAHSIAYQRNMT